MDYLRSNTLWSALGCFLFICPVTHAQQKNEIICPLGAFSLDSTTTWLENAFDHKIPDSVQVIGLGEFTHGGHEVPQVKAKTFQFLVEKKGYRTLLFEYPNAALALLNFYLRDNQSTDDHVLQDLAVHAFSGSLFDKALLDLLLWIKHYNLAHPNDLIALKGVDISGASGSFSNYFRHNFSSVLDTLTRKRIENDWATTSIDTITNRLIVWQNNHKDSVAARLKGHYADFLNNVKNAQVDIAYRKMAETKIYKASYLRDSVMARNVEELRVGKSVFWAHNGHVSTAYMLANAGNLLKKDLGDQYYVIAIDFSEMADVFVLEGATGTMKKNLQPDKKVLSRQLLKKTKISQGIVFYDDLPKLGKMTSAISSIDRFGGSQILKWGRPFDALIILKTISPTLFIH